MIYCPICKKETKYLYAKNIVINNKEFLICNDCFTLCKKDVQSEKKESLEKLKESIDIYLMYDSLDSKIKEFLISKKEKIIQKSNSDNEATYKDASLINSFIETDLRDANEHKQSLPKEKTLYNKLIEAVGSLLGFVLLWTLIFGYQIWPRHVYKIGCEYLKENVLSSDADYMCVGYDKNYIGALGTTDLIDLGQGKMTYRKFKLAIPVQYHTDEFGDLKWTYEMDIYIHPFGQDGKFTYSRYVDCNGEPTWVEDVREIFDTNMDYSKGDIYTFEWLEDNEKILKENPTSDVLKNIHKWYGYYGTWTQTKRGKKYTWDENKIFGMQYEIKSFSHLDWEQRLSISSGDTVDTMCFINKRNNVEHGIYIYDHGDYYELEIRNISTGKNTFLTKEK